MIAQMASCRHERAKFFTVQRLGAQPPIELWHCPTCKTTLSVDGVRAARKRPAAA